MKIVFLAKAVFVMFASKANFIPYSFHYEAAEKECADMIDELDEMSALLAPRANEVFSQDEYIGLLYTLGMDEDNSLFKDSFLMHLEEYLSFKKISAPLSMFTIRHICKQVDSEMFFEDVYKNISQNLKVGAEYVNNSEYALYRCPTAKHGYFIAETCDSSSRAAAFSVRKHGAVLAEREDVTNSFFFPKFYFSFKEMPFNLATLRLVALIFKDRKRDAAAF